jgi:hypothetical protein
VVLKHSLALKRNVSRHSYQSLKDRLIRNGSLLDQGDSYLFVEDVPFNSPSGAAAIIRGQNTNGRDYWKLENGLSYGAWFDARIDSEEASLPSDEES